MNTDTVHEREHERYGHEHDTLTRVNLNLLRADEPRSTARGQWCSLAKNRIC
jgi:hypothetical protein